MSVQFQQLSSSLEQAIEAKNLSVIENETTLVFFTIFQVFMRTFADHIQYIKGDLDVLRLDPQYILSKDHADQLQQWLQRLDSPEALTDSNFGKLKLDLEEWYYKVGGQQLMIGYEQAYLLNIAETCELLGVSKPTLYKYIQNGLECLDTSNQKKIPRFAVELWKHEPLYMLKMQRNFQIRQLRNMSVQDRFKEVSSEITELELKYGDFITKFGHCHGDDLEDWDEANDYNLWKDLLEEKEELLLTLKQERT
ncbi:helix-turn-helix domain-containing protein [Paenibacillus sp. WLX2291]|uniref:helix-turn-helix domain-containing protein n=1 Tax=Paenibacillus sp. WLX2291 TaxID=3296934 RepID=UPI003983ECEE